MKREVKELHSSVNFGLVFSGLADNRHLCLFSFDFLAGFFQAWSARRAQV